MYAGRDFDGQRAAEEIEDVGPMDGTAVREAVCSETDAGADFAGVGAAVCGAGEEEVAFAGVAGKGGGAFELGAGFTVAAWFVEEVGADAGEKMVPRERGFGSEGVYECETGLGQRSGPIPALPYPPPGAQTTCAKRPK